MWIISKLVLEGHSLTLNNIDFLHCLLLQILSVADLCSAYLFLAKYNLKKRNLEAAEMYAHKCCEFNEVSESSFISATFFSGSLRFYFLCALSAFLSFLFHLFLLSSLPSALL